MVAGRRSEARALAGFIPDCIVLFKRLLGDPEIPRGESSRSGPPSSTWRARSTWFPTFCR